MTNILFVALISRDAKPLYMQMFDERTQNMSNSATATLEGENTDNGVSKENPGLFLKYNFLAHMALDVFASPMALLSRETAVDGVALLFVQDSVSVYGMESNNGLKIVVGMDNECENNTLRDLFGRIFRCYIRTVCNPFSEVLGVRDCENMLQTERFDARIKEAIRLM